MTQNPDSPLLAGADTSSPVLQHAFDIRLDFHTRLRYGPICGGGELGFVGVAGGTIQGPLLNGRVVPNTGGDYAYVRPDGVIELNAHYLLEASDGTLIYIHNRGFLDRGRSVEKRDAAPQNACSTAYYFRITPVFRTPVGPHDWLTRTIIVGFGERRQQPDHSLFRYYLLQ